MAITDRREEERSAKKVIRAFICDRWMMPDGDAAKTTSQGMTKCATVRDRATLSAAVYILSQLTTVGRM